MLIYHKNQIPVIVNAGNVIDDIKSCTPISMQSKKDKAMTKFYSVEPL